MDISFFSISDFIRFLENYFIFGMFLVAPLFQIYRTIKRKDSHGLSIWMWIALLTVGIIFLSLAIYYNFEYRSKSILLRIFDLEMILPLFFIFENILMIYLIAKYKSHQTFLNNHFSK